MRHNVITQLKIRPKVVIIYNRLYIFTILPSIVDDPVTVDLKMMRDE